MNWFVSYIYREANANLGTSFEPGQNSAVDSLATKIALQTGINNGIAPTQILSMMNQGLGTNFTITDYNRAAQEFGFPTTAEPPAATEAPPTAPQPSLLAVEETAAEPATSLLTVEEKAPTSLLDVSSKSDEKQISLPEGFNNLSPREKAGVYNNLISRGFKEDQIRTTIESSLGKQSNADWGALKDIASVVETTGQIDKGGAFTTNFGDENSWQFGKGAEYNEKNMIESSGAYFQRGNDVIVSDELFWNPDSPTGEKLAKKISGTQGEGKRAGVVITPYAVFQNKATNQQLLDEVKRSGADFVAIDPYVGFGIPKDQLLAWTKEFVPKLNELGVGVKLVLQDFSKTGMEEETKAYNNELLQTPGISEFISFGLEDAKDLQGSPEWTSLSGGKQFAAQPVGQVKANVGAAVQTEKQAQSTEAQGETAPQTGLLAEVKPDLPSTVMQKASELLASSGKANNAQYADQPVGSFGEGGKVYSVYGDGSITAITEGTAGDYYYEGFTPEGTLAAEEYSDTFKQTPFDKAVGVAANALIAAATTAALGPAGLGLSTPAAAAIGSGATTAISTGDLTQAAKAALLAGAVATGIETIAPSTATQVAKDATNLAASGASEEAIKQALIEKGVNVGTAGTVAADAAAGVSASQIATDIAGITLKQAATTGLGAPNLVEVASSAAPGAAAVAPASIAGAAASQLPGLLATSGNQVQVKPGTGETATTEGTPAVTGGLLSDQVQVQEKTGAQTPGAAPAGGLLGGATAQTQTTTVTGQTGATNVQQTTAPAAAAAATAAPQTTTVTGQNIPQGQQPAGPAGAMLGTTITTPSGDRVEVVDRSIKAQTTAPIIPVTPAGSVTVEGKREVPIGQALIPAGAAGAALGVTTPATPVTNNISLMDAATAAMLLSGLGSLLDQGDGGYQMDPDLANRIINAPRPNYGIGVGGGYQMPGMFQIAPTNVYNPFATTAPFGTGRFGGFSAPITLPRGLV